MVECTPRRLLIHSSKPYLYLEYATIDNKYRRRRMPLRGLNLFLRTHAAQFNGQQQLERKLVVSLMTSLRARHGSYLNVVNDEQLSVVITRLVILLLSSYTNKSEISERADIFTVDLNKLDDVQLAKVKADMDVNFEKQRVKLDDPNFVYDIQVDFSPGCQTNDWDNDEDEIVQSIVVAPSTTSVALCIVETTIPTPIEVVKQEGEYEDSFIEEDVDELLDELEVNETMVITTNSIPISTVNMNIVSTTLVNEQPNSTVESEPIQAEEEDDVYSNDFGAGDTHSETSDQPDKDSSIDSEIDEDIAYSGDEMNDIEGEVNSDAGEF